MSLQSLWKCALCCRAVCWERKLASGVSQDAGAGGRGRMGGYGSAQQGETAAGSLYRCAKDQCCCREHGWEGVHHGRGPGKGLLFLLGPLLLSNSSSPAPTSHHFLYSGPFFSFPSFCSILLFPVRLSLLLLFNFSSFPIHNFIIVFFSLSYSLFFFLFSLNFFIVAKYSCASHCDIVFNDGPRNVTVVP